MPLLPSAKRIMRPRSATQLASRSRLVPSKRRVSSVRNSSRSSRRERPLPAGRAVSKAIFGRILCRSEEHTSELQSLMRISYAVFCLKKKKTTLNKTQRVNYKQQVDKQRRNK